MRNDRRQFLTTTTGFGIALLSTEIVRADGDAKGNAEADVTATEDLMREHGVLNRLLLILEEGLRRLPSKDAAPGVFRTAASLIRKFVEDYHEKLEENFIFPEFEKRRQLMDLVQVLRDQHQAGRRLTDTILHASQDAEFSRDEARQRLADACRAFIRMYRPHESREDTVLFPALHRILTAKQLDTLGDQFEEQENKLFGQEGFERTVDHVVAIEKQLGIYDLSQFTPRTGH